MKITLSKSAFLEKLIPCMGTVSNKNSITAIEGVLIETIDGRVRISTYDMSKGIRAMCDAVSIEEEGSCIIRAQRLLQTVRVLPDNEDFTIEVSEDYSTRIYAGNASFSMFARRGSDFPALPDLKTDTGFNISAPLLKNMIARVEHSVAEQDNRPMLNGAFVQLKAGHLTMVSCDGYSMSKCDADCEIGKIGIEKPELSFILPGHSLGEIIKVLPDGENDRIDFYLTRKHAILSCGDVVIFTRTVDSSYIDYTRVMPEGNDIFVTVERERLLSALERANLIAEERIQGTGRSYVKLVTDGQRLTVTSASVNGKVSDEMDCVHEGDEVEIGFNCRYLISAVRASFGEHVKITLKDSNSAITIVPGDENEKESFFYMLLPVRMAALQQQQKEQQQLQQQQQAQGQRWS